MEVNLILPNQLFDHGPIIDNALPFILVEEFHFFDFYRFHKQKLLFQKCCMRSYEDLLKKQGRNIVDYIPSGRNNGLENVCLLLINKGFTKIHIYDPVDDWVNRSLVEAVQEYGLELEIYDSPLFINTTEDLNDFFRANAKKYFQTTFYKKQRIKLNLLMENGKPSGGKWTYDDMNRKKYPKGQNAPFISFEKNTKEVLKLVEEVEFNYAGNPGIINPEQIWPSTHEKAILWLEEFFQNRFFDFGIYEDAIVKEYSFLNHSLLSPLINVGLLNPKKVIELAVKFSIEHGIPLNSTEGFIRQITGWREFIRGVYSFNGRFQRTKNFWNHTRKIPDSFYSGKTGIEPIDSTIKKLLHTGYNHHIERLMILGNFMLLCEFDPDEVYQWFMEMYLDSYDWVMVPNVYGMSQFADGGLMCTKPYISSSNYILKMSNYSRGKWCATWDALFWRFMIVNRDFLSKNPRLKMLLGQVDKWTPEKMTEIIDHAEEYLNALN